MLDPELGQLQYFINEHNKDQKPRGSLPLIGSSVALSDEFPFMFTVYAANGDLFKLRGECPLAFVGFNLMLLLLTWSFVSDLIPPVSIIL